MWPEPSVSGLISRPLPGSPGRPTFQHRALPREGLAEEENHFSRLARPGPAFLPRPCPWRPQEMGLGPSTPRGPHLRARRLQTRGLRPVWGLPPVNSLSAEVFWLQRQLFPRRAGPQTSLCVCQIWCFGFGPRKLVTLVTAGPCTNPLPPGQWSRAPEYRGWWAWKARRQPGAEGRAGAGPPAPGYHPALPCRAVWPG